MPLWQSALALGLMVLTTVLCLRLAVHLFQLKQWWGGRARPWRSAPPGKEQAAACHPEPRSGEGSRALSPEAIPSCFVFFDLLRVVVIEALRSSMQPRN